MERLGWEDKQRAYQALRAVLHALRDHLTVDQAAGLASQLPMLIRGFYYEGWHPAGKPLKNRNLSDFMVQVASQLPGLDFDPEDVVRAVFQVIARHVTLGEIDRVCHSLPRELRNVWTEELNTVWL